MQKDLIPHEHDGEKVKEELDGGARSAQDRQQVYNKAGCAGGRGRLHTSTARSCARILQTEPYCEMDTFTAFCEMRQTFTVLIKI